MESLDSWFQYMGHQPGEIVRHDVAARLVRTLGRTSPR